MTGFVITVEFKLKPGAMGKFRDLIDRNATESCRVEPGCRRFDVLVPQGQDDTVFLYEIYDDRTAFDAHLTAPHFRAFDRDSAAFVLAKRVNQFVLVCEGSGAGLAKERSAS
jgi:quinol monooxygenase YgiN